MLMANMRQIVVKAAAALILAAALQSTAIAAEKTAGPAPAQCRGIDMLDEFATASPDLYKKVIEEASALENSDAILWRIEKDGVEPSYLFGTMHLSDSRITTLTETVKDAIAKSGTVVLEVADLSDNAVADAMTKAAELVVYTDGRNLQSQLTDEEYKKVQELVAKSGMPGEFAGLLRPWIVSMLLAMSDCERKQVAAGAPVLDMRVAEEAQKKGLAVKGLESVQSQLTALAAVPDDQQVQMLKVGLKYADRADDMMETLVQMYLKRRIGAAMPFQLALAAQQGTPASAFDGFKQTLLVERNEKMRDTALPILNDGKAFIAIGALHLPGPTGLVALLRGAGYRVTAIE